MNGGVSAFEDTVDFGFAHDQQFFTIDLDGAAAGVRADTTLSPSFTARERTSPLSSRRPVPTATTTPVFGFSAAEPGRTIPPAVLVSSSLRRTTTRSCNGRIFIVVSLPIVSKSPVSRHSSKSSGPRPEGRTRPYSNGPRHRGPEISCILYGDRFALFKGRTRKIFSDLPDARDPARGTARRPATRPR